MAREACLSVWSGLALRAEKSVARAHLHGEPGAAAFLLAARFLRGRTERTNRAERVHARAGLAGL